MKKQTQAIDVLVNLVDWMMNNNREALAPAFEALKLDADTVFDSFDLAYGEDEESETKEHPRSTPSRKSRIALDGS
jgi:hypothetical protein